MASAAPLTQENCAKLRGFRAFRNSGKIRLSMMFALASCLFAARPSAAVTVDATSSSDGTVGTTSLTFTHTLGSGSNRLVVCGVQIANPSAAVANVTPTVTFGGIAMTAITASQAPSAIETGTSKIESEMFYLNDSSLGTMTGAETVSVRLTTAPTGGLAASCTSFFGMAQTGPESAGVAYNGSSGAQTITLSVATAGDLVIDSFAGGYTLNSTGKSATQNSGQTQLSYQNLASGGIIEGSSYELPAAAGSVTVGWTPTVSRLAYSAVAFAAAATVNYTVTTSVSPTGTGTISLSPNALSYASGTPVQVTATPNTYYSFVNFTDGSGNTISTSNPATITVSANTSVVANFAQQMCTLTIATTGSGSGTVTPSSGSYACGGTINLTATPSSGSNFGGWSGAGYTGTSSSASFTLTGTTTETASFVTGTICTISTSVTGSGSITLYPSGGSYTCGTAVTATAVPAADWSFSGFSGALSGSTNPQQIVTDASTTSVSLAAAFTQTSFPVNVTTVGPGTVNISANQTANADGTYPAGTQVTLTGTPSTGAYLVGYTGDLTSPSNPATVTVNSTLNITATFAYPTITKDSVSYGVSTSPSSVLTWTHTLGTGTSRAVVIAVGTSDSAVSSPDANAVVTGVYFNGVYATPIPNSMYYGGTTGMSQTQLFYLTDAELPATAGSYTVEVDLVGSVSGIQAGSISLFGVNQGPPEAVAVNRITSGGTSLTSTITTLTNNAWVIDAIEDTTNSTLTPGSSQTLAWTAASTGTGTGGSSTEAVATAGSVSFSWTAAKAQRMIESLAAFPPATTTVPATYTLTTQATGGTISTNPGLSALPAQTAVLLTATPAVGYSFSSWSIDSGATTSTANPFSLVMNSSHTATAVFTTAPTCTVSYNYAGTGSGTVTPAAGTYNCGTTLNLSATPASGSAFTSWTEANDSFTSTDNPTEFTVTDTNTVITVEFDTIQQCTLTMGTTGTGSVSPGTGSYACGSTITLTASQTDPSWPFSGWSGDYSGADNPTTIVLNNNMSITGNFTQGAACTLSTSVTGLGSIVPGSGTWACGTTIPIAAVAGDHYLFDNWGGALSGNTTPTTLALNSATTSVSATFTYNTAGVTGDTRTVTQPVYPPICTVLTAAQSVSSPIETSPDTTRVQAALNACASGEAVEFSASKDGVENAFIIAPITLPAGVTMLVDPEVTILGSIQYSDYSCSSSAEWCSPLIGVAQNTYPNPGSAIMGLGVIDGRGGKTLESGKTETWWATGQDDRPRLIYLGNHSTGAPSDNFTAYQITLKNSPKFHLSGVGNDLTVWGIKIIAPPDSPNTDGIDPSGSSNITITNSYISDGDDWISPKADSGHIANVTISNDHTYSGHGISIGSETNAGLNNMLVKNVDIDNGFGGTSFNSLRIKSDSSRGGEVYDVLYKDICINNGGDTIVIDPYYSSGTGSLYPNFHDITFSNVHQLQYSSKYKSTWTGYNTSGIVYPLTVTLDNVVFDGAIDANDFAAPKYVNNAQFNLGPGPVNFAPYLTADAATASNLVTVTNNITDTTEASYDCTNAFVYLAGDLTAPSASTTAYTANAAAGASFTLTAVLQNTVSPPESGTIAYPQQNMPTGTIEIMENGSVVGSENISSGSRLTYITIPANLVTAGTHTYTAYYTGDSNFAALSFGSFTLTASVSQPVATSQSVSVAYNTPTAITLSATGSGTLTYTVVNNPTDGTLSGTAPNLIYTPNSGYSGTDSFTFKANNGTDSNVATVSITVQASAPVANSQSVSVAYNTATAIALSATGSGTLTYTVVSNPTNGTLSGTAPNLTYTPTSGYSGADSFTFKANNGTDSNVATVSITVLAAAPVATAQTVSVSYNTATAITLTATGSGTMTYTVVGNPTHGTLSGTAPNLTYTPTSGYSGTDSFTFKANNGTDSNVATISITVLAAAPVATAQTVSVSYNTATAITLTATGSGTLTYTVISNPTHGTLSGTAPNLTYTPTSGYSGTDSFTFKANNGTDSNVATVSITVLAAAPVAAGQSVSVSYNTATAITLSATGSGTLTYTVVGNPTHGTLSGTAPNLTYTPTSGYSGADSFTFKANNGTDSNVATVSITVLAAAPVAAGQSVSVSYNTATAITLTATGSGTLTYTVVSNPTHGTLSGTAPNLTYTPTSGYSGADSFTFKANNGTDSNVATVSITVLAAAPVAAGQSVSVSYNTATAITLTATGSGTMTYTVVGNPTHGTLSGTAPNLTYTPNSGYSGTDSFTFKANNGSDSNVATVSITVLAAAPVATAQTVSVSYNTATAITLSATGSGTLTYTVVSNPTHGTLSGIAPNLTYTPTSGYSGADSFTFKANNGTDSNVATVSITVLAAAPVATAQSVSVSYNTATAITLSATGSGTLTYTVVSNPTHGTLSGTAPNLTYTPNSGYSGVDSFTFKANNGTDSNVATISITVLAAAPVAAGQTVSVSYNSATAITLSATGSGTLTYTVVSNPTNGTLSGTAPNLTYTPNSGYSGTDSFTFKANNGTDSNVATVSITVAGPQLVWSVASGGSLSATVTAGQNATYDLQIAGWTGANGSITFSCTGVPADATCTVSPNPLTLNGTTAVPLTVTISTETTSASLRGKPLPGSRPNDGVPLTFAAGIVCCLFGLRKKMKGLRSWGIWAVVVALALSTFVSGCSAPRSSSSAEIKTSPGTYLVTLSATSGTVTKSQILTLTVQ
jgi:hypothetical protein